MKVALLLGCKPKNGLESSFVQLREGTWILRYENVVDSLLHIVARNPVLSLGLNYDCKDGYEIVCSMPTDVKMMIVQAGTESEINVHAEKVA